eukprot:TRINITY_DN1060_c0_g1_i1.p1 TRINITY_DN1060_c0_g1~~TRINITY_DN1060_c0_g1_i1.p1  ORF type:complete len:727 (-),score=186.31 TRINITY_DN1060_c0_g1_i1:40-2220(-)
MALAFGESKMDPKPDETTFFFRKEKRPLWQKYRPLIWGTAIAVVLIIGLLIGVSVTFSSQFMKMSDRVDSLTAENQELRSKLESMTADLKSLIKNGSDTRSQDEATHSHIFSEFNGLRQNITGLQTINDRVVRQINDALEQVVENITTSSSEALEAFDALRVSVEEDITQLEAELGNLTAKVQSPRPPCTIACVHGGFPSADCSYCKNCDSGWGGPFCAVPQSCIARCSANPANCACLNGGTLDPANCQCQCLNGWVGSHCQGLDGAVSAQDRINVLTGLKNAALAKFNATRSAGSPPIYTNLGNGIDMSSRIIGLPVLEMTFSGLTAATPTGSVFSIPDGTQFNPILGGTDWPIRRTQIYEKNYDYLYDIFQWGNLDGYLLPLFKGISLQTVLQTYFTGQNFMSMTEAYYGAYSMSISAPVPNFQLEFHAQQAISYLSNLPYNAQTQSVFFYFLENWGTNLIVDEVQGGFLQFACVLPPKIWQWSGVPGGRNIDSAFLQQEADGYFQDRITGSNFASFEFQQNSVCDFFCQGGNPQLCPSMSNSNDRSWTQSIWNDPQSVRYDVIPIANVISAELGKHSFQEAVDDYYSAQVDPYLQDISGCASCLPTIPSMLLAVNVPWNSHYTIKANTCSSAIRITAWGGCAFLMYLNGAPINGGINGCGNPQAGLNAALWGAAAVPNYANPITEWMLSDLGVDNTISNVPCNPPNVVCGENDWVGYYTIACV